MELDDLKGAWTQYDKKLTENLRFNEELFRKLNIDKSRREMNAPLIYEICAVVISVVFLIFLTSWTINFSNELIYLISGILSILIFITGLGFAVVKIGLLSNIDYHNSSVIELQKALYRFKDKYFRFKRIEIFLNPFYVVFLMPICAKGVDKNFDLISHPLSLIIPAILFIGIGLPVTLWIYKHMYEKKMKNACDFIKELKRFEDEK